MVLLLRHTALRVSDVCTLRRDAISWDREKSTWRVLLRTQKSGEPVFLPIPERLKFILDALPPPRNAAQECPYYFWNAHTARRAVVGIAERTLSAVFKKLGVKDAHAHRGGATIARTVLLTATLQMLHFLALRRAIKGILTPAIQLAGSGEQKLISSGMATIGAKVKISSSVSGV
jgi:integrase